jgi:hypothetical protein
MPEYPEGFLKESQMRGCFSFTSGSCSTLGFTTSRRNRKEKKMKAKTATSATISAAIIGAAALVAVGAGANAADQTVPAAETPIVQTVDSSATGQAADLNSTEATEIESASDGPDVGSDANPNEPGHQDADDANEADEANEAEDASDGPDSGPDANADEPGHQDADDANGADEANEAADDAPGASVGQ